MLIDYLSKLYYDNIVRRIAVSFAVLCVIYSILNIFYDDFNGGSAGLYLFGGFIVAALVDFALLSKGERAMRLEHIETYNRDNSIKVTFLFVYSLFILLFNLHDAPSNPSIANIYNFIDIFGVAIITMSFLYNSIINDTSCGFQIESMRNTIKSLAYYSLILFIVSNFGNDILLFVAESPDKTLEIMLTTVILLFIYKMGGNAEYGTNVAVGISTAKAVKEVKASTAQDSKYAAAHEAGHVLIYAALGYLPEQITVAIQDNNKDDNFIGYVSALNSKHRLDEAAYYKWFMLVLLAGKIGEKTILEKNTLGNTNDHDRWTDMAKTYLSNHFNGVYYSEVSNQYEQEANDSKINALQGNQTAMIEAFFSLNTETYQSLYLELLDKKSLDREGLLPFMKKITIPDDFPMPLGKFESFNENWPDESGLYMI